MILFSGNPRLLVHRLFAAPLAKFLELQLPLHGLLVLGRIIIPPLANGTAEGDQFVGAFYFRHGNYSNG